MRIGAHLYQTRLVIAQVRHDVILGMPWHHDAGAIVDYKRKTVSIGELTLKVVQKPGMEKITVQNICIKDVRRTRKSGKAVTFGVKIANNLEMHISSTTSKDSELQEILTGFSDVFKKQLPMGLPPICQVDHKITIDPEERIPYRGLYQLSPEELLATREYLTEMLHRGDIRPSKRPFGAPLFFS